MSITSNIRIITPTGELSYKSAEDLGITLNRIVDDLTAPDNRFQDFSYGFVLPFTRSNSLVFGAPEALGRTNIFVPNQSIPCQVYLNNTLLLDGLINLDGLTSSGYRCTFYSKFKELIDSLNAPNSDGSERTLRDLQFEPVQNWDYEDSIIAHINANLTQDQTFYQYPISKYSTFYAGENVYSGLTDSYARPPYTFDMRQDNTRQNFYYLFNSVVSGTTRYNRMYVHQIPPAIYLCAIVEQILTDAGWKLGGQFFNDSNLRKIVYTYAGDEDIYDQATGRISGSTGMTLQIGKFLPEIAQADFLKDVINLFNLYMSVDQNNHVVTFETYNTLFNDFTDPYNITDKIDTSTLVVDYVKNNDPSISFSSSQNRNVLGDNFVMSGSTNYSNSVIWEQVDNKKYTSFMNRIGTTDPSITLESFAEPNIQRTCIWNDYDITNAYKGNGKKTIYLPCLTKQTPTDNANKKFNAQSGDTYLMNNESTISFAGKGTLMYYYGFPQTTFLDLATYMYINMYTSSGAVKNNIPMAVVSPMQLNNNRAYITTWLAGITPDNVNDRRTITATYMQALYQLMGTTTSQIPIDDQTDFSLVFDDNGYMHETIWSKFHAHKWNRYKRSQLYTATMRMDAVDWNSMQINRSILYRNELFSLVSIQGYDPIKRTATITIIKKL